MVLDETKLKVNGQCCFIWVAIDVDTCILLAIYVSWQRSIFDCETFLRKMLLACTNKPAILADKGPGYLDAFETYKIEWVHQVFRQQTELNDSLEPSSTEQNLSTTIFQPQQAKF